MDNDLYICRAKVLNKYEFDRVFELEHNGNRMGGGVYEVEFAAFSFNSKFKSEVCEVNCGGKLTMLIYQNNNTYVLKMPGKKATMCVVRKSIFPFCGRYIVDDQYCIHFRTKIKLHNLSTKTIFRIGDLNVLEAQEFICDDKCECIHYRLNSENFVKSGFPDFHALLTICLRENLWGAPDCWP